MLSSFLSMQSTQAVKSPYQGVGGTEQDDWTGCAFSSCKQVVILVTYISQLLTLLQNLD
jgi:hypothetical protein